jgi:hypothetical protein
MIKAIYELDPALHLISNVLYRDHDSGKRNLYLDAVNKKKESDLDDRKLKNRLKVQQNNTQIIKK